MTDEETEPAELTGLARGLRDVVVKITTDGIGPIVGSVDYAHARLRDAEGGNVPPPADPTAGGWTDPGSPAAERAIGRIVRESVAASGGQGFLTGIGGFMTLPVTIPVNLAGSLVINARMVGSIAYLRGYAINDPHTQAILMLTVAGSNAQAVASAVGVKLGQKFSQHAIQRIPIKVIRQINATVGFMLVAKYGTKRAAVTLVRVVPVLGGVSGGAVDASLTRSVAAVAKRVFHPATM